MLDLKASKSKQDCYMAVTKLWDLSLICYNRSFTETEEARRGQNRYRRTVSRHGGPFPHSKSCQFAADQESLFAVPWNPRSDCRRSTKSIFSTKSYTSESVVEREWDNFVNRVFFRSAALARSLLYFFRRSSLFPISVVGADGFIAFSWP